MLKDLAEKESPQHALLNIYDNCDRSIKIFSALAIRFSVLL